ncbi:M20/M25/M40 family metallo-hydrolase [Bacillus sp. S13(2024)]|uniref:M20/M25/M40 family metallo-hydrolase n=1 Tax=unclassified Bacillus (in: firmicutes) TaxID=185979 RepID=UPI003D1C9974
MRTWNQLFIRQGFKVEETQHQVFDLSYEREENRTFLLESLQKVGVVFCTDGNEITIEDTPVSEQVWLQAVDFRDRGLGESLWFSPGKEEPKIRELDTYISGVIRELNRLGLYTMGCCDGHEIRRPRIGFRKDVDLDTVTNLFTAVGVKRVHVRGGYVTLYASREELLDITEKLHYIQREWLEEDCESIQERFFEQLLEQLLSVSGASGNEENIRNVVKEKLIPFVDYMAVDTKGNILAQKTYRGGAGPTILLNAHLDTVEELEANRVIVKNGSVWSSSKGILGADDRAGVAVVLETAKRLASSSFCGKVKFIFTVEEEIGLVGASHIDEHFLWNVDAAIVADRRGYGDIVVSCGGYEPFCGEQYGEFIEQVAQNVGLEGWKCTAGGSSDTRVWAAHGIQSVNLSVGYQHEHTEYEQLDVGACYRTVELIGGIFEHAADLRRVLSEVRREHNVVGNLK